MPRAIEWRSGCARILVMNAERRGFAKRGPELGNDHRRFGLSNRVVKWLCKELRDEH